MDQDPGKVSCPHCNGLGIDPDFPIDEADNGDCYLCEGDGIVKEARAHVYKDLRVKKEDFIRKYPVSEEDAFTKVPVKPLVNHSMGFIDFGDHDGPKFRRLDPMTDAQKEAVFKVNIDYHDNVGELLKYFNKTGILLTEKDKHEVIWKSFEKLGPIKFVDNESITNSNPNSGDHSIFSKRRAMDIQGPEKRNW